MEAGTTIKRVQLDATSEGAFRAWVKSLGLLKHVMDPYFAAYGITGAQWGVLRTLARAEDEGLKSLRLADVGRRLWVRPPSVTGVVARLQRLGLLTLLASADDQRAKQASLTPAGRKLLNRVLVGHGAQIESILRPLSGDDRVQLRELLERLVGRLEELAGRIESKPGAVVSEAEDSD
jgi:DNA-binding MarR family transcriptional regulator